MKFCQSLNNPNVRFEDIKNADNKDNFDDQNLIFTLGFTAGIRDLNQSQGLAYIQPPEDKALIVLDHNDHGSKSEPIQPVIDTQKLLSNYNRKLSKSWSRNKKGQNHSRKEDVKTTWQNLNLKRDIREIFNKHEVDFEAFKLLQKEDLLEMGITDSKVIKIILSSINKK